MDAEEYITGIDHLIKLSWKNVDTNHYIPHLIVWNDKKEIEQKPLKYGSRLSVSITPPRICVGYVGSDLYRHPCPAQEELSSGHQCKLCYQLDVNSVCSRCTGAGCDAPKDIYNSCINTQTRVYIAGFKGHILKVGVTRESRGLSRWLEQGADYAVRLTTCPTGIDARKIEDYISANFGITKKVNKARKKKTLAEQYSLEQFIEDLHLNLANLPKSIFNCKVSLDDIYDLHKYYGDSNLAAVPHEIEIPRTVRSEIKIVGRIVSIKGTFVIFKNKNSYYFADFSKAYGYHLDWDSNTAMNVQSSLDDFF